MVERIRTLFREQDIPIFSILTALSMTISTIALTITGACGGGGGGSPPKDEGVLNKWLNRLADALKKLPAIVGSIVGVILSFLCKALDLLLNIHGL